MYSMDIWSAARGVKHKMRQQRTYITSEDTYIRLGYKIKHWHGLKRSFLRSEADIAELYGDSGQRAAQRKPMYHPPSAQQQQRRPAKQAVQVSPPELFLGCCLH